MLAAQGTRLSTRMYKRFTAELQPDRYAARVQNAFSGISAEQIARICQVDVATARRWKSGRTRIPYSAQALVLGDLGAFGKHWDGWRIAGDTLYSPDNWQINRNHALSVPLQEALLKARDARIQELEAEVEYLRSVHALQDQPDPQDSPEIKSTG